MLISTDSSRSLFALGMLALAGDALAEAGSASPDAAAVDRTVPTFTSLSDGQPSNPGELLVGTLAGVAGGAFEFQAFAQYTPTGSFGSNSLFTLTLPAAKSGRGIEGTEAAVNVSWQQRWIGGNDSEATFSTTLAVEEPIGRQQGPTGYFGALALNVLMGKGVGYLNGYYETQSGGSDPSPDDWSLIAGYKSFRTPAVALLTDVVYSRGKVVRLEGSLYINSTSRVTLGPGVYLESTLNDGSSHVTVGAGVVAIVSF